MKDWQAAIRTWERNRKLNKNGKGKERYHSEGHAPAPLSGWNKIGGTR